jgi:antitoxin HicB
MFERADEGGFVVTFPDFEWGVTQGDTEEEAQEMAADALSMILAHYVREGKRLPAPHKYRGAKYRVVRLPALIAAKAALYSAFLDSGIRKSELARRLRVPRMNVDRLFDFRHQSRLELIEAALRAIGKELDITIHDAA